MGLFSGVKRAAKRVSDTVKKLPGGNALVNAADVMTLGGTRLARGSSLIGKDAKNLLGMGKTGINAGAFNPSEATKLAIQEQQAALERSRQLAESQAANRQQALTQMGLAATGRGPSLAEAQLKSAQDRNLSQMLATAQSARGVNPALAQRALLQAQSSAGRELAQQAAEARLAERNAFLQQAAGVSGELQTGISGLGGLGAGRDQAQMALAQARAQADEASRARQAQLFGSLIGGAGSILGGMATGGTGFFAGAAPGAAATPLQTGPPLSTTSPGRATGFFSDATLKENVKSAKKDMSKFLDALEAKAYKYKEAATLGADEDEHYGVMAQALEKSKVGKSMVKDTPVGKMVDTNRAVSAILAAQSNMHKRMKTLEKKRG